MRRCFVFALLFLLLPGALAAVRGQSTPLERTEPPRADRITLSDPDEEGFVRIEGQANSVFPGAVVGIKNLFSGETVFAQAGFTGTFSARIPGVPGNPYLIQGDNDFPPRGAEFPGGLPGDIGVILTAPVPDEGFGLAGLVANQRWTAAGYPSGTSLTAGEEWSLTLDVVAPASPPFEIDLILQPIASKRDDQWILATVDGSSGWVAETTPTGIALDGMAASLSLGRMALESVTALPDGGSRFTAQFQGAPPGDLPDGLYAPLLRLEDGSTVRLPLVLRAGEVDAPTPLTMVLFMDDGSDGARGLLPEGEIGALSHGPRWNGSTFILAPGEYPVEPYLPTLLLNQSEAFAPPLVPFVLPGGQLRVTVERPDGRSDSFDEPFTQTWIGTSAQDEQTRFGGGPVDVFRLTTGSPDLAQYPFDQYGAYQITLEADLSDAFGNVYNGGGTYRVLVAEPLELLPGLLPGAPIPAGQPVSAGLHLSPPVPALITATLTAVGLDGMARTTRLNGQADAYGVFASRSPFIPRNPGEYRMDYTATWTDSGGRLWAGSLLSAGVVDDPHGPLVTHGGRGAYGQEADTAPARYSLDALNAQTNGEVSADGVAFNQPFYADTRAQIGSDADFGLAFPLHLQDTAGEWAASLIEQGAASALDAARGELSAEIPGMSYAYISAVTPGFSVRQQVVGGPAAGLPAWVSADDPLNAQIGTGATSLAPGDLVFLFGGAVVRGEAVQTAAGYASLAVITEGDPVTYGVFARPPAGSGPLAFIPTTLIPGQRVTVGDSLVIGGQVAPPGPAQIEAVFTRPDGTTETVSLEAGPFGYAYDPATALRADMPGVWRVALSATTATGTASVPGAEDSAFLIYVLPEGAETLAWNTPRLDTAIPGSTPYNFNFMAPSGWDDVHGYWTMTMPGTILADGEARLSGHTLSGQYNPVDIHADAPNFEVEGRIHGPSGSDAVTITVAFTGVDADGGPQIQARTFTIFHDRLITMEPTP